MIKILMMCVCGGGVALVLLPHAVSGQTQAVECPADSKNPNKGARVERKVPIPTRTDDISITLENPDIHTTKGTSIYAEQRGLANIDITVSGGKITSTGAKAVAIRGYFDRPYPTHPPGRRDVTIKLRNVVVCSGSKDATGPLDSHAIHGEHRGTGKLLVEVDGGSIRTDGRQSHAILAQAGRLDRSSVIPGEESDVHINVRNGTIITTGDASKGISGHHYNEGEVAISVAGGSISTEGESGHGIYAVHRNDTAFSLNAKPNKGKIIIDVKDAKIDTSGKTANGIFGHNGFGDGPLKITVQGGSITTTERKSHGVAALHLGIGPVEIAIKGGSIETKGDASRAISSIREKKSYMKRTDGVSGPVTVRVSERASLRTLGTASPGILMYNHIPESIRLVDESRLLVDIGKTASVDALGTDSHGVQFGRVNDGTLEFAAAVGKDGYRQHTIRIDGSVQGGSGNGAAVVLAGGGKVFVGPEGRVGAASGVAIRTAIGLPDRVQQRLLVDVTTGGHKISGIIEGLIVNYHEDTDISVNGVALHDAATGKTGLSAPNGMHDVLLKKTVNSTSGAQEFQFVDIVAPRAALYEALPGFLSRLESGRMTRAIRLEGGDSSPRSLNLFVDGQGGSFVPQSATVGADYDWRSRIVGAKFSFPLTESLQWEGGAHLIHGHAAVSATTGGGRIEVSGSSVQVAAHWQVASSSYIRGGVSTAKYDLDVNSFARGRLLNKGSADAVSGHLEAGRLLAGFSGGIGQGVARTWLHGGHVSIDGFKDRAATRVVPATHTHMAIGIGMTLATDANIAGIEVLSLHGNLGAERTFRGARTNIVVAGQLPGTSERLTSHMHRSRILFGAGAIWRKGNAEFAATIHGAATHRRDISLNGHATLRLALK